LKKQTASYNLTITAFLVLCIGFLMSCGLFYQPRQSPKVTTEIIKLNLDTVTFNSAWQYIYRASDSKKTLLQHTKLAFSVDFNSQTLAGQATLTLCPNANPSDTVVIDAKAFLLNRVGLIKKNDTTSKLDTIGLEYKYNKAELVVKLPRVYMPNESYILFINYIAQPTQVQAKGSAAIKNAQGLYFINADGKNPLVPKQVWTQGETESTSCWCPTIDNPNQKCTQEFYIKVPKGMICVSNGEKGKSINNRDSTETTVWRMKSPHSPYLFMFAMSDFAVSDNEWKGKPVNYYVDPLYQEYADEIFGKTPLMMEQFSTLLNYPYPWPKYDQVVVHDFVSGAMENTSATIHGSFVQCTTRDLIDKNQEEIIAHELFHQWFGDLVTCESWSNIALNESFATYGEYLWNEVAYGKNIADVGLLEDINAYLSEAKYKTTSIVRYNYADKEDLFDRHSYQKGACVLHMLREQVGDRNFFKSLNLYLTQNAYKTAELANLRLAFEEVTGEDLSWFFNQWFLQAGHPKLKISYAYAPILHKALVNIEQTQDAPALHVFTVPIKIDVYQNGIKNQVQVILNKRKQVFEIDCLNKPDLINVDADKTILCEKVDQKSIPEFIFQYKNAQNYIDQVEALNYLTTVQKNNLSVSEIFELAITDNNYAIRKQAVENIDITDSLVMARSLNKVEALAQKDIKSSVRAAAIKKLATINNLRYVSLFETASKDSSYLVCAAAIKGLGSLNTADGLRIAPTFENEKNLGVIVAVAQLYSNKGTADNYTFYANQLKNKTGYECYDLINHFGNYLLRMSESIIERGTLILLQKATQEKEWPIRYAAYQAIANFASKYNKDTDKDRLTVLNSILSDIREQEKDPKLKLIYSQLK
jgi:aminopeptidase N